MGINTEKIFQMYKSTYLAVRVHTEDEALGIEPRGNTDILLWLIDVYDLGQSKKCATAVKKLILANYFNLHERVPGMLPRWTKGMMAWVTYLNALVPSYEHDEDWVIRNNFMIQKDPESWSVEDMLTTLDAIAMRWHNAHTLDRKPLLDYLHCIWSCAKKYTMKLHDNIPNGLKEGDKMKIHPKQIMACLSRFFWFHKTLDMYDRYERKDMTIPCGSFFKDELRHFILRKFRDQLLTDVWETIPFWGDKEIAEHDQLGDRISTYSALYKRHPVCLLQRVQRCVLYDEPEDVRMLHQDAVDMKIIQTYFQNNYKVDFKKFFVCFEKDHPKHEHAVQESTVPIMVQSFRKFSVIHDGVAYCHGSVAEVFPVWVHLATKPHGLNISDLRTRLFQQSTTSSQGSIYELSVH